jgi:hypothetical protein
MPAKRQRRRSNSSIQSEEWPEKMNASQARKFLGVSPIKMTALLRSDLPWEWDPIDMRVKLVKRSALEDLLRKRGHD